MLTHHFRNRRRQRRLAVINVSYRPYIDVWFASIEFLFCTFSIYSLK